jgi:hypothetical protein
MYRRPSQVSLKVSVIAQLAKQAAYKEALNPALLGAGLGGLLGGAGGAFINPGVDEKGKKRSRLRNALIGGLGGAGLGGAYGYYNTVPDLKEEDLGIRTRPGEDRKGIPPVADPLEPEDLPGWSVVESGLDRVRNLPPVEFNRPTQLPRQGYSPDALESGLARVRNLPRTTPDISSFKDQASAMGVNPSLRMTPTPGGRANPFEVGNAPISSFKDQASAMGVNPRLRMTPTPGGRANPFEVGNADISSFKDQASAMGVNPSLRMTPTPGGRANPFEVGNADITPKPTPDFSLLNRVLAQKPNSVGKAPINNLESGLARVRNLPPVEFNRPTQLPRQVYQPDVLESGLARVNNLPPVEFNRPTQLPRQGYSPDALASGLARVNNLPQVEFNRPTQLPRQAYQPSGNFSLANPSIGGPSFAIPFDVRNLAPQLNPPPIYTANTQDTFNQTVRPHLVQGLNRLLQTGRVANRMRPNARNVIMDYVNNSR